MIYKLVKTSTSEQLRLQEFEEVPGALAPEKDMHWEEYVPPPPPEPTQMTFEEVARMYVSSVQMWMDQTVRARNYDSLLSACTYATDPNPMFAAEGQACVAWRSAVWTACYQILADVQSLTRGAPASTEDLIAELPTIVWP
jgi:hypothetical protein